MPVCVQCGREAATSEFRRRRGHPGEFVCWDTGGCKHRVTRAKHEERARNLSQANRRRIEIAYAQLSALRESLGPVFDAAPLASVRDAWTALAGHLHGEEKAAA